MESNMPAMLREETKKLLYAWYYGTEDVSFNDFVEMNGSNELKKYCIEAEARDKELRDQGITAN